MQRANKWWGALARWIVIAEMLEKDHGDQAKSTLDGKVLKTFAEVEEIANILVNTYAMQFSTFPTCIHLLPAPSLTLYYCLSDPSPRMFYMNKGLFLFTKFQHQSSLKQSLAHNRNSINEWMSFYLAFLKPIQMYWQLIRVAPGHSTPKVTQAGLGVMQSKVRSQNLLVLSQLLPIPWLTAHKLDSWESHIAT